MLLMRSIAKPISSDCKVRDEKEQMQMHASRTVPAYMRKMYLAKPAKLNLELRGLHVFIFLRAFGSRRLTVSPPPTQEETIFFQHSTREDCEPLLVPTVPSSRHPGIIGTKAGLLDLCVIESAGHVSKINGIPF
jgi:hypothetical protein